MKSQALEAIGETDLQHPTQVNAALAANNRLKFHFSLLQMAIAHAERRDRRSRPGCNKRHLAGRSLNYLLPLGLLLLN